MFEPGTQVGRYEIQRRLGRGGMGTVYVAHDPVLGRMVAIKVFAGELDMPDARERFSREARAAAALNHPNIVTVFDFGEYEAQPFIVMEYVAGETLASVIRRKVPVSTSDKLRWMEELCAGAGYAHQMSVIHRDIKPANLMLDRAGRLKILDFGIARMLGIASNTSVMIGTPGYMAPEQITGETVDHRSDQFSIGVVFYELLAYTEAFPGDTLPMITHRILTEEPVALDRLVPEVSEDVIAIVGQALKKNIGERFRDAEAMRAAINRVRRQFETDGEWNTPTMPVGRDVRPTSGGSRGTGSSRRRAGDLVGVAQLTPPPDPRRTDREALARRRTAQLEAALAEARKAFEEKQLEAALDACQQALTYDENHVGAIELEHEIETAIRIRDGVEVAADDSALTTAADPFMTNPDFAGGRMFESQAVTRFDQFDPEALSRPPLPPRATTPPPIAPPAAGSSSAASSTAASPMTASPSAAAPSATPPAAMPPHVAPPQSAGVSEKTAIRLPTSVSDATIVAPGRRTPPPQPPPMSKPEALPSASSSSAKVAVPAMGKAGKTAKGQPAAASGKKAGLDVAALMASVTQTVRDAVGAVRPAVNSVGRNVPTTAPRGRALMIWAGAGVLALVAVIAGIVMLTRGPVQTGTVVLDAVPWATITAIEDEGGAQQPLPSPASTPVSLALPVGNYQITLTGPDSKVERVSVRVDVGGTHVVPVTRFRAVTPEEYFEQYLGAGAVEGSPAAGSVPPADAAPTPAPAPTGAAQ